MHKDNERAYVYTDISFIKRNELIIEKIVDQDSVEVGIIIFLMV